MENVETRVTRVVRELARVNPLTSEFIAAHENTSRLLDVDKKQLSKAMFHSVVAFRIRKQFGRLRAVLLLGATVLGGDFLIQIERAAVLMRSASEGGVSFLEFLRKLSAETAVDWNVTWKLFHERLSSYLAYETLLQTAELRKNHVLRVLGSRPRRIVRTVLALTALAFLRQFFDFQIPTAFSELIDELGSPESVSSVASLIVVLANDQHLLDSYDFAFPIGDPDFDELREVMMYGKTMEQVFEVAKYISLFRYKLEALTGHRTPIFRLSASDPAFEYSLRLGFVRSQINAGVRTDLEANGRAATLSMRTAAQGFADAFREKLAEVKDDPTEWRRLRLNFPAIPKLYNKIRNGLFYEDFISEEQDSKDFLLPHRYVGETLWLNEHLDLKTFHDAWRYFKFLGLVDVALLRPYCDLDSTVLLNSLVRVTDQESLIQFVEGLGISNQQASGFIDAISADAGHLGYFDLQYRPFLRITPTFNSAEMKYTKPEIIQIPALVCTSNMFRNVQSSNKVRVKLHATEFVDFTAQILGKRFARIVTNRPINRPGKGQRATDIDIVILEHDTLYLLECKHSLPPTGPHEMRDIWEDIEGGVSQLQNATEILNDTSQRQSYLASWFPGIKKEHSSGLKIVCCLLCSHRIFSGYHHQGIPIRDFSSLALLCGNGLVGMGGLIEDNEVVLRQYRVIHDQNMAKSDLDNYLSENSLYFRMFKPFMHPISRIERLNEASVARETYVYEMDFDQWAINMESLGFEREQDRREKLLVNQPPLPPE